MSEYTNKKGVVLDHNFPVMPIILMIFALAAALVPVFAVIPYQSFSSFFYIICALLMFAGMVLHRLKLQFLTGIGTLVLAAEALFSAASTVFLAYQYSAANAWTVYNVIYSLLSVAAFTVTGLHYVLRKPKPGKAGKLILMIPLTCLRLITMIVNLISAIGSYNPVYVMLNDLSFILMAFALMVYTPFRKA